MSLTKADLSDALAGACTVSKTEAKQVVDGFFQELCAALERGERVKLARFGIFAVRDKRPRAGRNPKTGEEKTISARRVAVFHASAELKLMVERGRMGRSPVERDGAVGSRGRIREAQDRPLASSPA